MRLIENALHTVVTCERFR